MEPHPAMRDFVSWILTKDNCLVFTAADVAEALSFSAVINFDLAILDLDAIPEPGAEALETLTRSNPGVPVIVVSGPTGQLNHALPLGNVVFLQKPLDYYQTLGVIRDLTGARPQVELAEMAR